MRFRLFETGKETKIVDLGGNGMPSIVAVWLPQSQQDHNLYRTLDFLSFSSSFSRFWSRMVISAEMSVGADSPSIRRRAPAAAIIAALSVERCLEGKYTGIPSRSAARDASARRA